MKVHGAVGDEQELGERELAFAQDAEGRGHGFALVAFLHHRRGQGVIARLAVGPQAQHAWHHEGEERGEQLLQEVADVEVLLPGLAHDGRGIDRVLAAAEVRDPEDRVVVAQRVVAVVVAEGSLGPALAGQNRSHERDLGVG